VPVCSWSAALSALAGLFLGGVHTLRPPPPLLLLTGEGLTVGASNPSSACFWAMTALMRRGCAPRLVASPSRVSMGVGAGGWGTGRGEGGGAVSSRSDGQGNDLNDGSQHISLCYNC